MEKREFRHVRVVKCWLSSDSYGGMTCTFLRSLELLAFLNEGSSLRSEGLMGSLVLGLKFEE